MLAVNEIKLSAASLASLSALEEAVARIQRSEADAASREFQAARSERVAVGAGAIKAGYSALREE